MLTVLCPLFDVLFVNDVAYSPFALLHVSLSHLDLIARGSEIWGHGYLAYQKLRRQGRLKGRRVEQWSWITLLTLLTFLSPFSPFPVVVFLCSDSKYTNFTVISTHLLTISPHSVSQPHKRVTRN